MQKTVDLVFARWDMMPMSKKVIWFLVLNEIRGAFTAYAMYHAGMLHPLAQFFHG